MQRPWQVAVLGGLSGADTSDTMLRNGNTSAFRSNISNNNITNTVALGQVGFEWRSRALAISSAPAKPTC